MVDLSPFLLFSFSPLLCFMSDPQFFPNLNATILRLTKTSIPDDRQSILQPFIETLQSKIDRGQEVKLQFICTHNSRRSQLAQIWARTASAWYGIPVKTYSGGVEVSAFNPRAVAALRKAGFKISFSGAGNPVYSVFYASGEAPVQAWSKRFEDPANPQTGFTAVMTCSEADENCPFIPGAEARIPLWYEDPKTYDGTPEEERRYDERSEQIGAEMIYVFSNLV